MKKLFTGLLVLACITTLNQKTFAAEDSDPILQIPIISDVHINLNIPDRQTRFIQALEDYKQIAPDYQVMAIDGDLTDQGLDEQYNTFNQILNDHLNPGAQALLVMGNHEFYQGVYWPNPQYTDQMFINRFVTKTNVPNLYYDKWIDGYHFITLGTEESKATNPNNHDYVVISDIQYDWLEQTLAENADPTKPIFVFLHEPIDDTLYGSEEWGGHLKDSRLPGILKKYPQVILFTGHLHYLLNHPRSVYQDGFTMVNTGAVAYTLYEGGNAPAEFSQGLLVNVYHDRVEIKAREFSNHTWINSFTVKVPYEKTIYDDEPPYFTSNSSATVDQVTSQTAGISWAPALDNTQVDKYLIMQNGKVIQTIYNQFWEKTSPGTYSATLANLEPNQDYDFDIVAVDAWNNQSTSPLKVHVKTSKVTGWFQNSNNQYSYYDSTGQKVIGWLQESNQWYYFNPSGVMQTGWLKINSKWYFFADNGKMATGWLNMNGNYYYLSGSGAMQTGWVYSNSKWYYLSQTGQMQTGWLHLGGKWCFLDPQSGAMRTGWLNLNNSWYYIDSNGYMKVGWVYITNKWYYFFGDGHMAANTVIGTYKLGSDGALIA